MYRLWLCFALLLIELLVVTWCFGQVSRVSGVFGGDASLVHIKLNSSVPVDRCCVPFFPGSVLIAVRMRLPLDEHSGVVQESFAR